ncbi:DNA-3-methyladenine glycosylase [Candidatus Pacearchaeota archaeon]|nr:DNA-3-methyladenine glycosylase [Candidatus Pacearchaeota archaeon]MBD3283650.1 DNA-3-methyladenine glycosylase [Candidatus Pacearchaeota archaeon]
MLFLSFIMFLDNNAEIVARELLGGILVRNIGNNELIARIVETEAYYGNDDPASRACKNGDLRKTMEMSAGTILVYGVHNNWMLNFVTGEKGKAEAVLIRAVEPLNFDSRCNGPGLLTKALEIDKSFHKRSIIKNKDLRILRKKECFDIEKSFRIGVSRDSEKPLRFYIKNNDFVSRK